MKLLISIGFTGVLIFTGCSTMPGDQARVKVESSRSVKITNAVIHSGDSTTCAHGVLRPSALSTIRSGHVHVEFLAENGELLETVHAEPNFKTFSRHSNRRPVFKAETEAPNVSEVRMVHHPESAGCCDC